MLDPAELQDLLHEIGRTAMPFGKYGPQHYPPDGVPLHDLPFEYLEWFRTRGGFPRGRLGELMRIVHQLQADGADEVFQPLRARRGGRTRLRPERRRDFRFGDG